MRALHLSLIGLALTRGMPAPLEAQGVGPSRKWGVGAGFGPAFPAGRFSATDNPGANGLMYLSYSIAPRVALSFDVGGMWTPHKATGHTELYELLVGAVWRVGPWTASPRPFLLVGIGSVAVDTDDPDRGGRLAFSGGAGVSVGESDVRLFVLARYVRVQGQGGALNILPITVGFATRAP